MVLLRLEPFPTFSKSLEKNKWADYLELLCLISSDKEISLNDIITLYSQEELSGISNGDEDHSEKVDKLRASFTEIFRYIFSRMDYMDDYYPFTKIDEDTIKMEKMDEKKLLYIFLLLSSNTSYITDNKIPSFFRKSFERISVDIMKILYPNFRNELFGTSTKKGDFFYGGKVIKKLEALKGCLNTTLKKKVYDNKRYLSPSGDGEIDLISYMKIDKDMCATYMLPACFGQCTTSYKDWKKKQGSIKFDSLNNIFEDLAHFHEYSFISFPLRGINGKWDTEEADKIQTIIIDRIRFLNILASSDMTTVLDKKTSDRMKTIMGEFDVAC